MVFLAGCSKVYILYFFDNILNNNSFKSPFILNDASIYIDKL